MKSVTLNHEELGDIREAIDGLIALHDDFGVRINSAEADLSSGQKVTIEYRGAANGYILSEVEL